MHKKKVFGEAVLMSSHFKFIKILMVIKLLSG